MDDVIDLIKGPINCPECGMDDCIYYDSILLLHGAHRCCYCPWYIDAFTGVQYDYYKRNGIFPGSGVGIMKPN